MFLIAWRRALIQSVPDRDNAQDLGTKFISPQIYDARVSFRTFI